MAKIKRVDEHMGNFTNPTRMAYQKVYAGEKLRSLELVSVNGMKANATLMPAYGFVRNDTQNVKVVDQTLPFAVVNKATVYLDTSFPVGTILYLAVDGTLTDTAPTTSGQIVQPIGVVIQNRNEQDQGMDSNRAFLDFDIFKATTVA